MGLSIAFELASRGRHVTLLERDLDVGGGASPGNAGYVVPSHATPLASPGSIRDGLRWMFRRDAPLQIRLRPALLPWLARFVVASTPAAAAHGTRLLRALAAHSLELHRVLGEEIGTSFRASGILNLYETSSGFASGREKARAHAASGLRVEVRSARATAEIEPAVVGEVAGSVLYPDEGFCDPEKLCRALAIAASARGAEIRTGVEALCLERAGRRVVAVASSCGRITGSTFVIAAGVWTAPLLRSVGVDLPIAAATGYHVEVEPNAAHPRLPVFMQEAHVTTTTLDGALRLTGGLDLGVDGGGAAIARRTQPLLAAARRAFGPDAIRRPSNRWHGPRPCTPDGLPAVGFAGGFDNLLVSSGHAMLGVTLAPIGAKMVADLIEGKPDAFRSALGPGRFRGRMVTANSHA